MSSPQHAAPDYKEAVRAEWTGAAPFWQKWNAKFVQQTRGVTDLIVAGAELSPGMKVLDLASGTGEPALSLAATVGPQGSVVATDLVPEMMEYARANAAALGIANIQFQRADAESLPFPDASFDRVTCRFGIMFFSDIPKAMAGIRRVLKPGGRVCFAVFGSLQENPMFMVTMGPFLKHVKTPPPPPDAPHIFRFADEAKLAATLTSAGFSDVATKKQPVIFSWPGSVEECWEATSELAAPFKKLIQSLPPEQNEQVRREILEGMRPFQSGGNVNLPTSVITVVGAV